MNTTKIKDPDNLVKATTLSIMPKGLIIAFVIHAVLILGTSIGLYRDWWGMNPEKVAYGFLATPSTINNERQKANRAAEEAKRQEVVKEREATREANVQAAAASTPARNTAASLSNTDDLETINRELGEPLPPARLDDLDPSFFGR